MRSDLFLRPCPRRRLPRGRSPRSRLHPERGVTLVELTIAMALSTLVVMGAFHMHSTFQYSLHRQDEITRIQETMKVTRRILERRLRAAGAGMAGSTYVQCGGEHLVGPFMLHNRNTFGQTDTTNGGADTDPDWIEIMGSDRSQNGILTSSKPINSVVARVSNASAFKAGGLFGIKGPNGMCIFMVSSVKNNKFQYYTGNDPLRKCYNPNAQRKACEQRVLGQHQVPAGSEIINLSSGTFALRIDNSQPARPVLMMASGVAGGDPARYTWQPLAENVEDLQVGVSLDTSNPADSTGDLWVNSRDLTSTELASVRAVRLSLVFRSASEMPGWNAGRRPALEDRAASTPRDGYLRRVLTTTIALRNMPQ